MDVAAPKSKSSTNMPMVRRHCFGLQLKSAIIITYIVIGTVSAGAWYYYKTVCDITRRSDLLHAQKLSQALSLAAEGDLRSGRFSALDNLAKDWVKDKHVAYVSVVDKGGQVVSFASGDGKVGLWEKHTKFPAAQVSIKHHGENHIIVAQPIVARDQLWYDERLAGGVRLVLLIDATRKTLAATRGKIFSIAAIIVFCAIPTGYILVWQFMVRPIRKLARITHRLARGDYSARAEFTQRDETGELASAFDHMADQVSSMRNELLANNVQLEQKVAERTEDLQRANGRLYDEMRDKEEFLRAVSHDLNAPLRNIAGMATMISMKWRDEIPEEALARLQRIQTNVDRETSLLEELLELSRIKSRRQSRQLVDIGQMLGELAETFEYELTSRAIELKIDPSMPTLNVEPNRIRQVFQNLIDNAIKYMHRQAGGRICVSHKLVEGMHEFCINDNGPGIPADQQDRVFCVFRRGDTGNTSGADGKGVGLAVVRTVVSTYDGQAWVTSAPGQGASFFFTLSAKATAEQKVQQELQREVRQEISCG